MDEQLYGQFIASLNLLDNYSTPAQQRAQAEEFQTNFHENENSIDYYLYILSTPSPGRRTLLIPWVVAHSAYICLVCLNKLKLLIISKWAVYGKDKKEQIKRFAESYLKDGINVAGGRCRVM